MDWYSSSFVEFQPGSADVIDTTSALLPFTEGEGSNHGGDLQLFVHAPGEDDERTRPSRTAVRMWRSG
jgi:hypothetical protein